MDAVKKMSKEEFCARFAADQAAREARKYKVKWDVWNYFQESISRHYRKKNREYWKGRKTR